MILANDIICAPATSVGSGAISVIRLSGANSISFVEQFFSKKISDKQSHTLHFGLLLDQNKTIDEVVVSVFEHGKSYTGEESVEISCHASPFVVSSILNLFTKNGARIASAGEFTQRAFFNGKLDLSQAEAVADLIAAQSSQAHEIALNQLRGNFSTQLREMREKLIHFASLVELELDFAEEDVEFADRTELLVLVNEVLNQVKRMIQSFELGNVIKNGVPVAIVGAPNTGKSTLLNQLLGEERAIVSNIEGTTRDTIEESLVIDGISFRLIDTAGIREHTNDEIESIGIQRSLHKINQAKIILYLSDAGTSFSKEFGHQSMSVKDTIAWVEQQRKEFPSKYIAILANKVDLIEQLEDFDTHIPIFPISAKNGLGLDELKSWMIDVIQNGFDPQQETIITNARHIESLEKTALSLTQAKENLEAQISGDFVAMDIRQAMYWLGTITGQISEDDLLANIFSKFCIGK